MPKVRASSATMGTMRAPNVGSFSKLPSMRTAAMVVLISLPLAFNANSPQAAKGGTGSTGLWPLRSGKAPPRVARCWRK